MSLVAEVDTNTNDDEQKNRTYAHSGVDLVQRLLGIHRALLCLTIVVVQGRVNRLAVFIAQRRAARQLIGPFLLEKRHFGKRNRALLNRSWSSTLLLFRDAFVIEY